jgi:hypothetical protein
VKTITIILLQLGTNQQKLNKRVRTTINLQLGTFNFLYLLYQFQKPLFKCPSKQRNIKPSQENRWTQLVDEFETERMKENDQQLIWESEEAAAAGKVGKGDEEDGEVYLVVFLII